MNKHNFVIKIHTLWHSSALSHLCLLFYLKQNRIVRCFFRSCCFTRLSFHFVFVGLDAIKSYFKKYDNVRPKGFTCFRREDETKRKKGKKTELESNGRDALAFVMLMNAKNSIDSVIDKQLKAFL